MPFIKTRSLQFLLSIIGILMVGALPHLLVQNMEGLTTIIRMVKEGMLGNTNFIGFQLQFNFANYIEHIFLNIQLLFDPSAIQYPIGDKEYSIFPDILDNYKYSMTILASGFFIGLCVAILLTYFAFLLPKKLRGPFKSFLTLLSSIPDIFFIVFIQWLLITIFIKYNFKPVGIFSYMEDRVYMLPILCLAIIPCVFLLHYLVDIFEGEELKDYVPFAKGKGISKTKVLLWHIMRNALISLFLQSKNIFWMMLSNLLVLEILFEMTGFMWYLKEYAPITPNILTVALLMLYLPFFLVFLIGDWILYRKGYIVE